MTSNAIKLLGPKFAGGPNLGSTSQLPSRSAVVDVVLAPFGRSETWRIDDNADPYSDRRRSESRRAERPAALPPALWGRGLESYFGADFDLSRI